MPTLVVIRHAKAEAPMGGLSDHDRALTIEGRAAASRLAERLLEAGINLDKVLVSSANRAQQTWKRMADSFPDAEVVTVADLYEAGIGAYQRELEQMDSEVVATIAHEPSSSSLVAFLAGRDSDRTASQKIALGLRTSQAAVLEIPSWEDLDRGVGRLVALYSGK